MMDLRQQSVTRYITPMREGGSLPALADADDGFKYIVKFRGAGHGTKALVAELIGGEIARRLGLKVPEIVFLNLDTDFGRTEPDIEIQELLQASRGLNLGLHYLSGAFTLDPYSNSVSAHEASLIVWLDAFITNVDRTVRNTNMLVWNHETWLIDHGAALYFHHTWKDADRTMNSPFTYIKDHALLRRATALDEADTYAKQLITSDWLAQLTSTLPDEWLHYDDTDMTPDEIRHTYHRWLAGRLENSQNFLSEAKDAHRKSLII